MCFCWKRLLIVLLSLASPLPHTTKAADDKPDAERIQGTWLVTTGVFVGFLVPQDRLRESKTKYVFDKDAIALVEEDPPKSKPTDKGRYRLDPSKSPKTIDLMDVKTGEVVAVGIYQLKGDELQLCLFHDNKEKNRPTEFKP